MPTQCEMGSEEEGQGRESPGRAPYSGREEGGSSEVTTQMVLKVFARGRWRGDKVCNRQRERSTLGLSDRARAMWRDTGSGAEGHI
jgi:hypothetical protein